MQTQKRSAFIMGQHKYLCRPILLLALFLGAPTPTEAAPNRGQPNTYPQETNVGYGYDLRTQIDAVRHNQKNHENELRVFDEKFETIQSIVDSLRKQLQDNSRAHKNNLDESAQNLESKFNDLEVAVKGAASDLKQLRDHANQSSAVLTQYQQRLGDMEKLAERQSQQIESLQNALQSIAELLAKDGGEAPALASGSKIYQVKSGDSLEKIAVANQTSVKVLKDLNNLTTDRIKINQKLKLP